MKPAKVFVFVLLILAMFACKKEDDDGCGTRSTTTIERDATEFGQRVCKTDLESVLCTAKDTDGDDYVTCTIFCRDRDPLPVLCAVKNDNAGCKPIQPKVNVQP